jgi:hypothetical protein
LQGRCETRGRRRHPCASARLRRKALSRTVDPSVSGAA